MGANGAGKSTLAQLLMGLRTPPPGSVLVDGRDVRRIPAPERTRHVGYVFQNPEHQFVTSSVADELRFGLALRGLDEDEIAARVDGALTRFGLQASRDANPFTLSHGQKRRLSVATMLVAGQRTLILDEPTFGQDQRHAEALLALLEDLHAEGRTIVLITHDMALVARHARTVAVLSAGRLAFHGPPEALFDQPELLRRAHLAVPPARRMVEPLVSHDPAWGRVATVDALVTACTAAHAARAEPVR